MLPADYSQNPQLNVLVKKCLCENEPINSGTGECLFKCTGTNVRSRVIQKEVNMMPKETSKGPATGPKEMVIYELSDGEFRIILLKTFGEL